MLKPVSKKRQLELNERKEVIKRKYGDIDNVSCEVGYSINNRCNGYAVDVHEPHTRARGGSITDPDNMVAVCRSCHDWIHSNPKKATELNLLSYGDTQIKTRWLRPT